MSQSIVSVSEAESYVKEVTEVQLEEVGTKRWLISHERLEKLTAQATLHVMSMQDEFVKEFFITYDKVNVLIYNLLAMECWKLRIFPKILEIKNLEKANFPLYTALHQELILCGLIDIIVYRTDGCQSIEQTLPDLVDYCYRNITDLIQRQPCTCFQELDKNQPKTVDKLINVDEMQHLKQQSMRIDYCIGIKSIAIICSIIDHLNELPFGIRHRLLSVHDTVLLLLQLIEIAPWKYDNGHQIFEFNNQKWTAIDKNDECRVLKTEGQVWMAILNLLMDRDNMAKYDIDHFRKSQLIKVRPRLTEVLVNQIPALSHLRRFLEQLSLFNPPPAKKDLIMEQTAFIFDGLRLKYNGQWDQIANQQAEMLQNLTQDEIVEMGKILSELYSSDIYGAIN